MTITDWKANRTYASMMLGRRDLTKSERDHWSYQYQRADDALQSKEIVQ